MLPGLAQIGPVLSRNHDAIPAHRPSCAVQVPGERQTLQEPTTDLFGIAGSCKYTLWIELAAPALQQLAYTE